MVGAVTAAAGITAAGVGAAAAVGSLAVGAYSAIQSGKAADRQLGIENTQLGMEQQLFGEQQGYADQLSKLLADPSSVTSLPGYKFNKDQGAETIARQFAQNPGSGAEGAALTRYGQDYASSAYLQQANLLASLSGLTQNPAGLGSVANQAGGNAIAGQGQSFDQLQRLLAQGGSIARQFGPGGVFSSAGTPGAAGAGSGGGSPFFMGPN